MERGCSQLDLASSERSVLVGLVPIHSYRLKRRCSHRRRRMCPIACARSRPRWRNQSRCPPANVRGSGLPTNHNEQKGMWGKPPTRSQVFNPLLGSRSWLLLAAVGCCWLLLAAAGCCWLAEAGCCVYQGRRLGHVPP